MTDEQHEKVIGLMRDAHVAMLSQITPDGALVSHPMATQDVDFDGTMRFIAERSSDKVRHLQADPRVNVAYSGSGSWLSVSGTARVVDDAAKLAELWDTFTDSWLTGGPDDPNNILIEVDADTAEYWSAPGGSTVVQLVNLVKSKVTGERIEGDNAVVDL